MPHRKALIDAGQGIEDTAARFGVTPTVGRQRMKLASVSTKLMALYRKGKMKLDQLMAFTVSDNHVAQEAAWLDRLDWQRTDDTGSGRAAPRPAFAVGSGNCAGVVSPRGR